MWSGFSRMSMAAEYSFTRSCSCSRSAPVLIMGSRKASMSCLRKNLASSLFCLKRLSSVLSFLIKDEGSISCAISYAMLTELYRQWFEYRVTMPVVAASCSNRSAVILLSMLSCVIQDADSRSKSAASCLNRLCCFSAFLSQCRCFLARFSLYRSAAYIVSN